MVDPDDLAGLLGFNMALAQLAFVLGGIAGWIYAAWWGWTHYGWLGLAAGILLGEIPGTIAGLAAAIVVFLWPLWVAIGAYLVWAGKLEL